MGFGDLPKLVRDKIPEISAANDNQPEYFKAEGEELRDKVLDKICEEALELREEDDSRELADLMEVIDKFIEISEFSRKDLEELREKKNDERGSFDQNLVLERSDYSE